VTRPHPIRLIEAFHSIFYSPVVIAVLGGHLAAEGLEPTLTAAEHAGGIADILREGRADVAISGLVRSFDLADRGGPRLVHFAAVNDRNGFFLLSRTPRPDFAWPDLVGRTVLSYSGAPTPWLCMQAVLRRHGIDPARVNFVRHLAAPDAAAAFRAGDADFLEHGPPLVDELVRDGMGHLVASMGEATGPLAFSSCMTTPDMLVHGRDLLLRFVRGLARAQRWMRDTGAEGIAEAIAPAFPDIPVDIRRRAVERYTRQHTWAAHPTITPEGFEALQEILLAGGFIARRHRFEELVDTSLVAQAMGGR
jgi:NitT/TauT family transport system substrate-binding protein